uniref:Glycosyltransferase n=1 Tax=Begonia x semperflorens-cultorum TaxID=589341 RepID=A0A9E7V396_9ROSI|nr:UDP-glucose:flavonoid 3-O-glucosyltransferase [Begonia x semperflorens-cultorum]
MKSELIFIPVPFIGHFVSMVETAKLLLHRDPNLSVTVFLMNLSFDSKISSYTRSLSDSSPTSRLRLIDLPPETPSENNPQFFIKSLVETNVPKVRKAVKNLALDCSDSGGDSPRLSGFVVDLLCTAMMEIGDEFGVPNYVYFASGAGFLSLMLQSPALYKDDSEFFNSVTQLALPSFVNPVPVAVLPSVFFDKPGSEQIVLQALKFKQAKGILINTFLELESYALDSFSNGEGEKIPPVYPVGPILNLANQSSGGSHQSSDTIMTWLEAQPPSSVLFLGFGSVGSFDEDQTAEIALALERSGVRFVWALREPPPKGKFGIPRDYSNVDRILPDGFLNRTASIGRIAGWVPQKEILAHPAIGGFVSHCGWNSILESLWYGVPIAAWPMYSEQQLNAYKLVNELGLAVEVKVDYRNHYNIEKPEILPAPELESAFRRVMDGESEIRKRVKEMSEKSRRSGMDGGSSFNSVNQFISDMYDNMRSCNPTRPTSPESPPLMETIASPAPFRSRSSI